MSPQRQPFPHKRLDVRRHAAKVADDAEYVARFNAHRAAYQPPAGRRRYPNPVGAAPLEQLGAEHIHPNRAPDDGGARDG